MPKKFGFLVWVVSLLLVFGCTSSTIKSDDLDYSLTTLFSAVEKAMGMGVDHYSENHREFYSRAFLVKQDETVTKAGFRQRGKAKVTVLGETRPYTIEVQVLIERSLLKKPVNELTDSDYAFDRYDKRLATRLLTNINAILDKRDKTNNFIDDFRSF